MISAVAMVQRMQPFWESPGPVLLSGLFPFWLLQWRVVAVPPREQATAEFKAAWQRKSVVVCSDRVYSRI